jgi:hypothetical protein
VNAVALAHVLPEIVATHFPAPAHRAFEVPVIVEYHTPADGWVRLAGPATFLRSTVRHLAATGVDRVALAANTRTADFGTAELLGDRTWRET